MSPLSFSSAEVGEVRAFSMAALARQARWGVLLAAFLVAACGGSDNAVDTAPVSESPAPAPSEPPAPNPPNGASNLVISALSASPTVGPWNRSMRVLYTFTVTNTGTAASDLRTLRAAVATTSSLPLHWVTEGRPFPVIDALGDTSVDVPSLAPGEAVTVTAQGGFSGQGEAWTLAGYLAACLFTEGTRDVEGCTASPVTITQVNPATYTPPLPTTVQGYGGEFPHAASPLDASVTMASTPALAATFGWDRPGPFGSTLTDDQVWSLDAATGVTATITMTWGTFVESIAFTASPVTLAPLSGEPALPFGTVLAAINIAPADLQTELPYTVRWSLAPAQLSGVSPAELVAFGADADGTNVRLLPVLANSDGSYSADSLRIGLRHFGIVGIATLSTAQRTALSSRWPRDVAAQTESAVALATVAARQTALASMPSGAAAARTLGLVRRAGAPSDDARAQMIKREMAYYNDVVIPAFVAAYGGGEAEMESATRTGLGWLRELALLGLDQGNPMGPVSDDLWTRINDLADRHADKVKEKCTAGGGFSAFQRMLLEIRQLMLMGHDAKSQELADALGACSSFTVDYSQAWADQNTNASLVGGVKGTVTLTAPTFRGLRAGSLPNGEGTIAWTRYQSSTTDILTTYDNQGTPIGSCSTTTVGTGTTGSQFTAYVKDYGLSFLKGGGHRSLTVLLWLYGTYNGQTHVPMGIHRRSTSTCPGTQPVEWDELATPGVNDPALVNRGDGMRIVSVPWDGGNYSHTWSVTRSADLHPTEEQLSVTVQASY